jgi:PAS domain S-box-containing protein
LFSLGYFLCAQASFYLYAPGGPFISMWLPAGLYVAVLLLNETRDWPWLVLAVLPANLVFDYWHGTRFTSVLVFYGTNTAEALLGAWLIRRFVAKRPTLATLGEFIGLLGFSAVFSTMLGATISAAMLVALGASHSFAQSWINWWTGEALAILLLSSFILTWFSRPEANRQPFLDSRKKALEAAFLVVMSIILTWHLLYLGQGVMSPNKSLLLLPLLWAGLRFGPRGATAANLLLALPVAFLTTQFFKGLTPDQISSGEYISVMQLALATGALAGLIPAIVIHSHNRTIMELHESEERFRNLTAAAFEGIFITENGRVLDANDQGLKMFGYQRAEMIGREVGEFVSPETRSLVMEAIRANRETIYEHQLIRKDGSYFHAEAQAKVVRVGDRTLRMTAIRDITERKHAQAEALWKTAFLEAQVDSALDGILVVDDHAKRILQNRRLFELFKVPDHISKGDDDSKLLQFVTNQTRNPAQFGERVAYLYAHPDEVGRDEIELADGRILDRYSAPVRDRAGKYYGRIWTFRDLTERRKLEEQFRQSQKMEAIGHLAGGVAHDFNNILAVIQMQSDLLKAGDGLSPEQREFTNEIGAAAQRAAVLTRQMLLFSRKERMQTYDLDLTESINDITKLLRRTLGEDIQLQFRFALQPLIIHADAGMLDQVLMNLAVNARDAMPGGGHLVIETSAVDFDESVRATSAHARPGSFACLSVSDTGSGIPPEILPRIFEPFFTTKDIGKGTGLGLATVFGIIEQHKGWLQVDSEVGRGTTFRIFLPRSAGSAGQKNGPPAALPTLRGGQETILLVEDDSFLRTSVRHVLLRLGYRVLEAANGLEALEVWQPHRDDIQLLLTDLVMPGGMTGKGLAGRLLSENPRLKVVYTSGYSPEIAAGDFPLEEGVNFLAKPFEPGKLAQTIRNRLDGGSTPKT